MNRRRSSWLAAGLLAAVSLSGCVTMPENGPVQDASDTGDSAVDDQFQFAPLPPQPGETPSETVAHWLEAMTATPVSTAVAREFLTQGQAATWSPEDSILTYDTATTPEGFSTVGMTLFGVNRLDARGSWLGPVAPDHVVLSFRMQPEQGQWRITGVPDALIVDESWFETTYQSANLYFFDPSARILVPEPVFVPRGDQFATSLVRGLLEGPIRPELERSFLPENASLDLAVTVTPEGVAQVPLRGAVGSLPSETIELMADQLAWTLRQDPRIRSIQMIAEGEPLALPGGATEFGTDYGSSYDPAGMYAKNELYGLRQGHVVRIVDGVEQRITGPFGGKDYGFSDVSANLDASLLAGVSRDGRSVSFGNGYGSTGGPYTVPHVVFRGGADLLHPAWDAEDRLWLVDRRAGGAVVSIIANGARKVVQIPGVTGEDVIDFLVSRDGTRFVAAVNHARSDRIVVSRIAADGNPGGAPESTIVEGGAGGLRIRDIGWRTPTRIYFVNAINGQQSELRSASVDGSPIAFDPDAVYSLQSGVAQVLGSPRPDEWIYLRNAAGGFTSLVANSPPIPAGVTAVHYVG